MKIHELQAAVEAILFSSGEPLETDRISQVLEIDNEYTEQLIENITAELDERKSGLCILKLDNKYQICSRKEYADKIRAVLDIKRNAPLSNAAFEVLAVVAYNQPVTKSYVEQIRGVDCSGVISTLCQRGLLEEKGRLELPGRPLLYGTTDHFLKCFCISSLNELPELPDHSENAQPESAENDVNEEPENDLAVDTTEIKSENIKEGINSANNENAEYTD